MYDTNKYFNKLNKLFCKDYHEFINLIPNCKRYSADEIRLIYKALHKAISLHQGQVRKTGEEYVNHPIAVASILAYYGFDYETICAALLHDSIEDTCYTLRDCENDFGYNVASLVDGVTKIGKDVNEPTHVKLIKSAEKDIRCIAIKLADRLHNMLSLGVFKEEKIKEKTLETVNFYIPITKILGIYRIKDELQDLCMFYLYNDEFLNYKNKREELKKKNYGKLNRLASLTQENLSKQGVSMLYNYRIKNVGSVHEEVLKGTKLYDIDDLLAIKMIVKEPIMCYQGLGVVHGISSPINNGVEDFIALPKSNGYKSLNTNVIYKDSCVQVRIRTEDMQKTNDLGVFSDLDASVQKNVTEQMKKELNKLPKSKKVIS